MKLQCTVLFLAAIVLTVSSKGINMEEASYDPKSDLGTQISKLSFQDYELMEKTPPSDSADVQGKIPFQEYQSVDDKRGTQSDDVESNEPQGPGPYRICLVVRCAPKWSPLQICWCVRWSK